MGNNLNNSDNLVKNTKKKKGFKFYLKLGAIFVLSVMLLFAVIFAVVFHKLSQDNNLEKILNAEISKATNMKIAFEKVEFSFPTIKILNTKIATDTKDLRLEADVKEVAVRPDFMAALKGKLLISYIGLDKADVDLKLKKAANSQLSSSIQKDNKSAIQVVPIAPKPIEKLPADTKVNEKQQNPQQNLRQSKQQSQRGNIQKKPAEVETAEVKVVKEVKEAPAETPRNDASKKKVDLKNIEMPFRRVLVKNIQINLEDENQGETFEIQLKEARLSSSMLSSSLPINLDLEIKNLLKLQLTGMISWPREVSTNIKLAVANVKPFEGHVPEEYRQYLSQLNGLKANTKLRYDMQHEKLGIEDFQLNSNLGVQVGLKGNLDSFQPLLGHLKAQVKPLDLPVIMEVFKDLIPQEYGLSVKKGTLGATAEIAFKTNDKVEVSVEANPEKIEVATNLLPETVTLVKAPVTFKDNLVKVTKAEVQVAKQSIEMAEFTYNLDTNKLKASANAATNLEVLWQRLAFPIIKKMEKQELEDLRLDALKVAGGVNVSVEVLGSLEDPEVKGSLALNKVVVEHPTLLGNSAQIDGPLAFTMDKVSSGGLKVRLRKSNLSLKGAFGIGGKQEFKGEVLGDADFTELLALARPVAEEALEGVELAGGAELKLSISGTLEEPVFDGAAQLKSVKFSHKLLDKPIDKVSGAIGFKMNEVSCKDLKASFGKTSVVSSAKVGLGKTVIFDATLDADANLEEIYETIKPFVGEAGAEVVLRGNSGLKVKVGGTADKPWVNGSFIAKDVYFEHPSVIRPVEKINGPVEFDLEKIQLKDLTAYWGKSKASVKGVVKDFEKLLTDIKFAVEPLDITDAAGFFLADSGYVVEGLGKGEGSVSGPLSDIKVLCKATAPVGIVKAELIENADVFKFPYKNLVADCEFYKNILNVKTASLNLFEGKVQAEGKVDIGVEPIAFDFKTNLDMLKTEEFLKVNVDKKFHDSLAGGIKGNFNVKGDVTGLSSLMGNADLAMPSGSYSSPPVLQKVAEKLKSPKFASGKINNYYGTTRIEKGRMISDNSVLEIPGGRMSFSGSVGLDTTLDGDGKLTLNKELFSDNQSMQVLFADKNTVDLPVILRGTLVSPDVNVPLDDMLKKAKDKLKSAVGGTLKEIGKDLKDSLLNRSKSSGPDAKQAVGTDGGEEKSQKTVEDEKAKIKENLKKEASKAEEKLKKGLKKLFR